MYKAKRVLSALLAVVMVLSMVTAGASAEEKNTYGNLTYTINEDNTVTITDCDTSVEGELEIPAEIGEYPVTGIGNDAFKYCTGLTSVVIPDSVTSIGDDAFYQCTSLTSIKIGNGVRTIGGWVFCDCTSLTSVVIPDSITSIGGYTFYNCTNLTEVYISDIENWCKIRFDNFYDYSNPLCYGGSLYLNGELVENLVIPDGVTSIGNRAFYGYTGLTSVVIPNSVTSIGDGAFYRCINLTSVEIGNGVTSIGESAFYRCTGLTSVVIPDSVTSIGYGAFEACTGLTSVVIPDSVTSVENYAFENCTRLTSVEIGTGVTSIGEHAFSGCTSLTSVVIPDSVTSIGVFAFYDCTSLTSIEIPDSVMSVGGDAFYMCDSLTEINVDSQNQAYTSQGGVLFDKTMETLIYCPDGKGGSYTIPSGVTSIADDAFYNCTKLTNIAIPDSVTSIEGSEFEHCSSLTEINVDSQNQVYTSQEGILFDKTMETLIYCPDGKSGSYTVPSGVTRIDGLAFANCISLTRVTIPVSVTDIGGYALGYEVMRDGLQGWGWHQIEDFTICGYAGTAAETYAEEYEIAFIALDDIVSGPLTYSIHEDGTATVADCAEDAEGELDIPSEIEGHQVTAIGMYAFENCTSLTSINIPDSITEIGTGAFGNCESLTSVIIPDGVTIIDAYVFAGCSNLTSITIPDSVTELSAHAFYDCTSLTSIDIPNSVTSFGAYTFSGTALTSVTIPNSMTKIADSAFVACKSLTSIIIPDSVTSIGESAFRACSSLTSVTISDSVTNIEGYSFAGCENLTSITIPASVTEIEENAFGYIYDTDANSYCKPVDNFTIYGYPGTAAETYAKENNITFIALTDPVDPVPPTVQFTDVKSTDWFYPYVTEAAERGLMSGTGDGQFSPYGTTTRAMFVQILYAMAGKPEVTIDNPFTDVPENAWYAKAVQWAYENGVTGGTGDYTFSPNANVTREQIAVFLYAYAGKPAVSGDLSSFADSAKVSGWAKNAVIWATQNKIISGSSEGGKLYLNPKKNATRAETATMMVGFAKLMEE